MGMVALDNIDAVLTGNPAPSLVAFADRVALNVKGRAKKKHPSARQRFEAQLLLESALRRVNQLATEMSKTKLLDQP
jgi:hypothetical protein